MIERNREEEGKERARKVTEQNTIVENGNQTIKIIFQKKERDQREKDAIYSL